MANADFRQKILLLLKTTGFIDGNHCLSKRSNEQNIMTFIMNRKCNFTENLRDPIALLPKIIQHHKLDGL